MYRHGLLLLSLISITLLSLLPGASIRGMDTIDVRGACHNGDPESQLVCGRPLRLIEVAEPELLLIPGLGQTIASRLLQDRETLVAARKRNEDQARAFERIKGIGPKRAKRLLPFLTLD